jgi:hypothetical protein
MIMDSVKMVFVSASLDSLVLSARHVFAQMTAAETEFALSTRPANVVMGSLALIVLFSHAKRIVMSKDIATMVPATASQASREPLVVCELAPMTATTMVAVLMELAVAMRVTVVLTAPFALARTTAQATVCARTSSAHAMRGGKASTAL